MTLSNLETQVDSQLTTDTIEEISIIIAARNLTPTVMSLDFLKFGGIVAKDWELSQQPILNPNLAQLHFKNGINITAQPRTITISESLNGKNIGEIHAPQIAVRYIEKLPHAEYLGWSFSPKILVPFPNSPQTPRKYITETLLNSGVWKNIGQSPVQAGINLMYLLDRCQLTINVAEARLHHEEMPRLTALLFSGNFNYDVSETKKISKAESIIEIANHWQEDLEAFREIVKHKFLAGTNGNFGQLSEENIFPGTLL